MSVTRAEIKKAFLYSLVLSVLLSAILAILAILSGTWDWFQVRVLLTTGTIAAASICGLANGAFLATKRGTLLPLAGIAFAMVAAALHIGGIWTEPHSDLFWRVAAAAAIFAVACAHMALISMARLAPAFKWSVPLAYVVVFDVALLIVLMIMTDFRGDMGGIFQILAVAAVVDAAITLLVPVFHWLSRGEFPEEKRAATHDDADSIDREIVRLKQRIPELERRKAGMETDSRHESTAIRSDRGR
jgi:hypothetical protein